MQLNDTPHTHGYTMKLEQRRPRLKHEEIYALAHKRVLEREALKRLNKGDKTTVMYTHRPSHNKTAVNAVHADATADPNISEPANTSVNAVGHPKPPAKKTVGPGPKPPPTSWVLCSKHWKTRKKTEIDMSWIDWGATNTTLGCWMQKSKLYARTDYESTMYSICMHQSLLFFMEKLPKMAISWSKIEYFGLRQVVAEPPLLRVLDAKKHAVWTH